MLKLLHITRDHLVRFRGSDGYYEKFKRSISECEQKFYIIRRDAFKENRLKNDDVIYENDDWNQLKDVIEWADRVIIHGLESDIIKRLEILEKYQRLYNKKYIWHIWGHDLYDAYRDARHIKGIRLGYFKLWMHSRCAEKLRKKIIQNVYCIMGLESDILLAQKLYNTKAKLFNYNQLGYGTERPCDYPDQVNKIKNVYIGNHLNPHCRYTETFERLHKIDDGQFNVYCVAINYSDDNYYQKRVIDVGRKYFGERLHLLTEQREYNDYARVLNTMDIGIFDIDRQMAQGTIFLLLYYGKRVFVSKDNGNLNEYKKLGIDIYDVEDLTLASINTPLMTEQKNRNRERLIEQLSDEHFKEIWMKAIE